MKRRRTIAEAVGGAVILAGLAWAPAQAATLCWETIPLDYGLEGEVVLGDVDGDGDLDIAVGGTLVRNLAPGLFGVPTAHIPSGRGGTAFGDIDGDSDLDWAIAVESEGEIAILLNSGGGSFLEVSRYAVGVEPRSVAFGDLDRDGALDIVVANHTTVSQLMNKGDGTYANEVRHGPWQGNLRLADVAVADVDEDGDLDAVVSGNLTYSSCNEMLTMLVNNGTGQLTHDVQYEIDYHGQGYYPCDPGLHIAIADLDEDGDMDIVAGGGTGAGFTVLTNMGAGAFFEEPAYAGPWGLYGAPALGDLDRDGDLDVVVGGGLFLNDGAGAFDQVDVYAGGFVALGALDGDDDLDMATSESVGFNDPNACVDVVCVPNMVPTVQEGIDMVSPGGTVVVAPGTYSGGIDLRSKAITVRSTDPHDSAVVAATVIDGGHPAIICHSNEGRDTVLFGLRIANADRGIELGDTSPTIAHCVFEDNGYESCWGGDSTGGAIQGGSAMIVGCVFRGNFSSYASDGICVGNGGNGGAIACSEGTIIINSLFVHNFTDGNWGGSGAAVSGPATMINCTVINNNTWSLFPSAPALDGVLYVANSVVWNNEVGDISEGATVAYSLVTNGYSGEGNIAGDPRCIWTEPEGRFRLLPDSPCIDAGDNTAVPAWMTTDLAGMPRFFDDPRTPDTGYGSAPMIDMGAYEFQGCPADLNGNGFVGFSDLADLLALWGPCEGCLEDIDGDGKVGFSDLSALLSAWGWCPAATG